MTQHGSNNASASPIYMVDGEKVIPVPEVMTEEEVIKMLRLDADGPDKPKDTLRYYREKGLLRATRIGKRLRYSRPEVLRFLEVQTDETNGENTDQGRQSKSRANS
jgi:hypothetical protein